jgi:hypothetical protein
MSETASDGMSSQQPSCVLKRVNSLLRPGVPGGASSPRAQQAETTNKPKRADVCHLPGGIGLLKQWVNSQKITESQNYGPTENPMKKKPETQTENNTS